MPIERHLKMHDEHMDDKERLEEIGRIMALGAIRLLRQKNQKCMRNGLDQSTKTGLIVRDRERFAERKRRPNDLAETALN